ncbi:MAG TPA: phosphotransferase [Anaerolineales bacterium]|nr:phosphotransferase [Anaerolineales bacterium]
MADEQVLQEYSKRLGRISPEQFQAALDCFGLGEFIKAEPVSFGLFGQNVFVTSTQGEFVLRGCPHYPWQFPTEQFIANLLHEQTQVPVPYPYLLEPSDDIFGWSFVIMPRLPGLQLQDKAVVSQLTGGDRLAVVRALAGMLVEVQTLTWEHAGKYDTERTEVQPFEKHYREWIIDNIREKLSAARTYNDHTTLSDVSWVEHVLASVEPVIQLPYIPCIVLGDYGEHNTLAMNTNGEWRISAVFDLMTAHFGDGQADLSIPVTTYLNENESLADAFVAEYLRWKPMQSGFVEHQRLYMLDLTLSFWRYWQRHNDGIPGREKSITFEQMARPSVDYWNKFVS